MNQSETGPGGTVRSDAAILAELAAARQRIVELEAERDTLRAAHERVRFELELLRRRIFVAKAERVDTKQLELEFAAKLAEIDLLNEAAPSVEPNANAVEADRDGSATTPGKAKPKGRRNLKMVNIPEERVEIKDPLFEKLVDEGKAERISYEESSKLAYKRGGVCRLVVARAKYRAVNRMGEAEIETATMPAETFARSLAAPSMLAHIAVEKHCDGLPLHRIEQRLERDGVSIDRGTMCRWLEDLGSTLGATVVAAAREEATRTAFCIATDATGVGVQPTPCDNKKHQACRRGHFFVLIADRDHIFFEYTAKETSKIIAEMFRGYSGYIQADAKSIYDILFRQPEDAPAGDTNASCHEIGCMSHTRRKFWEATVAKDVVAREGLARINRIFEIDRGFKGKPPSEIKRLRDIHLRPHMQAFFAWADEQYKLVINERGLLRSALGYSVRQKDALMRVLDDGRLVLENNRSERELRRIAVGRKAWLFMGSDDHARSAGHIFSLIASSRLHGLDPEAYLRDVLRVLAHWPRDRYLELTPKYWKGTRDRLSADELALEVGDIAVPPPRLPAQQDAPSD